MKNVRVFHTNEKIAIFSVSDYNNVPKNNIINKV